MSRRPEELIDALVLAAVELGGPSTREAIVETVRGVRPGVSPRSADDVRAALQRLERAGFLASTREPVYRAATAPTATPTPAPSLDCSIIERNMDNAALASDAARTKWEASGSEADWDAYVRARTA
ncbi:MAG TPA: hypothetical protein VHE80_06735, partial [Acidimicrobiales bacterium]|nr:hypothetical protein [Acidimicrobiales bacterium]